MARVEVVKRDGRRERFLPAKLYESIRLAAEEAGLPPEEAKSLFDAVRAEILEEAGEGGGPIPSSRIADRVARLMVERGLRNPRWFEAAKRYELARIYNDVYGKGGWGSFDPADLRLTFNAIKVLEARYLQRDPETGRFKETPQMMFRRVARFLAGVERRYGKSEEEVKRLEEEFYRIMSELRFMPNSPTLMNSDTPLGILSACFVVPVRDSIVTPDGEGIMDAVRAQAVIFQHGGGVGFDFSEIRPANDVVLTSGGTASGPLSFMRLFDLNTEVIKQGGRRRGANMGIMHVWHADVEDFIVAKTGELKDVNLQNFNISVAVYDAFMERALKGGEWPLINPRKTDVRGERDSRYYAMVRARHYLSEEWVQEYILRELEERGGSIALDEALLLTFDEALAIAEAEGAITRWVNARSLLEKMVRGAWESGDPGIIFIDEINRRHPVWYLGKINSTNPCVSGDTRILTPEGWLEAREVFERAKRNGVAVGVAVDESVLGEGGEPVAYRTKLVTISGDAMIYRTAHGDELRLGMPVEVEAWVWHVGRKDAYKVRTREGYEIVVTAEHKFLTPDGWREASNLRPGDRILLARLHPALLDRVEWRGVELDEDVAFALGWLVGDGTLNEHYVAWFFNRDKDRAAEERVRRGIEKLGGNPLSHTTVLSESEVKVQYNKSTRVYRRVVELLGGTLEHSRDRRLPEIVWRLKPRSLAAFLRGLFTADGYVDSDKAVRLTSASLELLREVQVLLTVFGIASTIHERPYPAELKYVTKDGEERVYRSEGYYELVIKGYSRRLFKELIGFESIEKMEKLTLAKTKRDSVWATVESVEYVGVMDFYDFTVPGIHAYIANGVLNHNCGEEPLLPWESCNLGSINLERYVVEGEEGPAIDWEGLARDVRVAVRLMDNVIDASRYPLPQLAEAARRARKIGLGVMGWARMLIRLGIPYDSVDAVYLAWAVAEWIAWNAYDESVRLAEEKGAFPAWDPTRYRWLHETRPFKDPGELLEVAHRESGGRVPLEPPSDRVRRLIESRPPTDWEGVKRRALRSGLRNAALLSIAPTGSISIIAGASASIEPLFALAYVRRVSVGTFLEVDPLFIEELRRLEIDEPEVIEEIAETGSVAHLKWIPRSLRRLYRTAHDIEPEWHLLHQAAWQVWVDAAVSKTVNLRHEEPPETVWRVYLLAWKLHLKGTTVYRDRSKSRQVIYFGVKKEAEKKAAEAGKPSPPESRGEAEAPTAEGEELKPVLVIEPQAGGAKGARRGSAGSTGEEAQAPKEGGHTHRMTPTRAKLRLGTGKVRELIEVAAEYAGGCPTCDI